MLRLCAVFVAAMAVSFTTPGLAAQRPAGLDPAGVSKFIRSGCDLTLGGAPDVGEAKIPGLSNGLLRDSFGPFAEIIATLPNAACARTGSGTVFLGFSAPPICCDALCPNFSGAAVDYSVTRAGKSVMITVRSGPTTCSDTSGHTVGPVFITASFRLLFGLGDASQACNGQGIEAQCLEEHRGALT